MFKNVLNSTMNTMQHIFFSQKKKNDPILSHQQVQ